MGNQSRQRVLMLFVASMMALFGLALIPSQVNIAGPVASAADDDDDEEARLRIVHASPDFGPVDITIKEGDLDEPLIIKDVEFFTVSDYIPLGPGTYKVEVSVAGEDPSHDNSIVDDRYELEAGEDYTIVARGTVADDNLGATVLEDDNSAPEPGQAKLRVGHFSPNAPAVDIFLDDTLAVEDLEYLDATGYLDVAPGTYTVGVAPADGDIIYTVEATIEAGQVLTAWANGLLGSDDDDQFKVTPTVDAEFGDVFRLRAIHAVPDIAGSPVDVFVDGELVTTFDFFDATDYLTLFEGTYDIRVALEGDGPDNAVIKAEVTFEAGQDYSVIARGTANPDDDAELGATVLEDDNSAPEPGQAKLRVGHFSPNAPAVDIFLDDTLAVEDLEYLDATGYLDVAPGTYTVGVAPADGDIIYTVEATIEAGQVLTAWANGLLGSDDDDQEFKVTPTVDAEFGDVFRLRAIHAVPDIAGSPVDLFVDGDLVTTFDFFAATDYLTLTEGTYDIRVALEGEGPDNAVIQAEVTFEAGKDYSVVARGTANPDDDAELGATVLEDDNSAPETGQAKLRVGHFSPNAPAVDIFLDDTLAVEDLEYLDATGYLDVAPGTYTVGVAPADGEIIYTVEATIGAGQVVTAWANGLLGSADNDQVFKVTPTVDAEFGDTFRLRAIHAVPDIAGNPVDVFVDGERVVTFDFFDATDYLTLTEGTYDIRVALEGEGPDNAVIQAEVTFEAGKDYSVVARGTANPDDDAELSATVLEDDNSAPEPGQAKLRVGHFSPNAPAVDIFLGDTLAIEDLEYLDATGYLDVAPGTYTVGVAPADGDIIYTVEATVGAGQVVTAWANGLLGGSDAQAFKVTPTIDAEFGAARLRVLHASPDEPNVDLFLDGDTFVTDLAFGETSEYQDVAPGVYDVAVRATGTDTSVLESTFEVESGSDYTIVIFGLVGGGEVAGITRSSSVADTPLSIRLFEDDNSQPAMGQTRLRVAHFAPNVGTVDVRSDDTVLFDDVDYAPETSDYIEIAPGQVPIAVTSADGSESFLSSTLSLRAGSVQSIFIIGLAGDVPEGQQLRGLVVTDLQSSNVLYLPLIGR